MSGDGGEFVPPAGGKAGVNFGTGIRYYRYLPPKGNVTGFDFATGRAGGLIYVPPAGSHVGLDFSVEYTPPAGSKVGLEFIPGERPVGDAQYLFPTGSESLVVGSASFALHHHFISLQGIRAGDVGQPALENLSKEILLGGIYPQAVPIEHTIYNHRQILDADEEGIDVPRNQVSRAVVSNWYQWVEQRPYTQVGVPGHAVIRYRDVEILPSGLIPRNGFGRPTIWREQRVEGAGIVQEHNLFGSHRLDIDLQRISVRGVYAGEFPDHSIKNYIQHIDVRTLGDGSQIFNHSIENWTSEIYVARYDDPAHFPQNYRALVQLKDRYSRPEGFMSQRFSPFPARIFLNARDVKASAGDTSIIPEHSVTHGVRELPVQGFTHEAVSRFTALHNAARLIEVTAIESSNEFGRHGPINNLNRQVRHFNESELAFYGTPFVAPRIRTLSHRGYVIPYVPIPDIRLNPHPLAPGGIPPTDRNFGNSKWITKLYEVRPKPAKNPGDGVVGFPTAVNRNRPIFMKSKVMSEYGKPLIENYIRTVEPLQWGSSGFGPQRIARREQEFRPLGWTATGFHNTHRIQNVDPDPPVVQRALVPTIHQQSFLMSQVPEPITNYHAVRPDALTNRTRFGEVVFWHGGVYLSSIPFSEAFGVASVLNRDREISVARGIPAYEPSKPEMLRTRVSPHTIYAPKGDEASRQAIANHADGLDLHFVDETPAGWRRGLGVPVVTSTIQYVGARGMSQDATTTRRVPPPDIALVMQRVRVTGWRSQRFNLPIFDGGDRWADLDGVGITPPPVSEDHTVAYAEETALNRVVRPGGISPNPRLGGVVVNFFHRELEVRGIGHSSDFFGRATFGFHRELQPQGDILSLWGDNTIDHAIRTLHVPGEDYSGWKVDDLFHEFYMLRVELRSLGLQQILPESVVTREAGRPTIGNYSRTVRPLDIPPPQIIAPRSSRAISPTGTDMAAFGDVHRYIPGVLQPRVVEVGAIGAPVLAQSVRTLGGDYSAVGAVSIARPVTTPGIDSMEVETPAVVAGGCYDRVIANVQVGQEFEVGDLWIR